MKNSTIVSFTVVVFVIILAGLVSSIYYNGADTEPRDSANVEKIIEPSTVPSTPETEVSVKIDRDLNQIDIKTLEIFLYVFISLLFIMLIFLYVKLSDVLKSMNKASIDMNSIDSKIQLLDKKISDTEDNYKELKQSFQSADKENFNLIQFPLDLNEKIDKFTKTIIDYSKRVYQIVNVDQKEKINEVNEAMKIFQETINAKSDELNQYKDGYDYHKKKTLIEGIIDNISRIDSYEKKLSTSDSEVIESFEYIKVSLMSLLNNNNVSQFDIPIGSNTLELSDKCDVVPETVPTDDESKLHTVESIIDNGYRIQIKDDEWKLIKKVKVKVFGSA